MTLMTFDLLFSICVSTFSGCVCAFAKKEKKGKTQNRCSVDDIFVYYTYQGRGEKNHNFFCHQFSFFFFF